MNNRPICREFAREINESELDLVSGGARKLTGKASGSNGDWDVEIDIEIDF
jgi:hypothetical protein